MIHTSSYCDMSRIRNGRFKNKILCQVPVAVTFMFYHLPKSCLISSTVTLNNRCLWIVCLYCDMLRSSRSNSTATVFRFSELCVLSVSVWLCVNMDVRLRKLSLCFSACC